MAIDGPFRPAPQEQIQAYPVLTEAFDRTHLRRGFSVHRQSMEGTAGAVWRRTLNISQGRLRIFQAFYPPVPNVVPAVAFTDGEIAWSSDPVDHRAIWENLGKSEEAVLAQIAITSHAREVLASLHFRREGDRQAVRDYLKRNLPSLTYF